MKPTLEQLNTYAARKLGVGCYVDGSASSADYLNKRIIREAVGFGFDADGMLDDDAETKHGEDYGQFLNETADEAVDYLNSLETRSYMAWTVDDNSLFLMADVDGAKEDVGFVSGGEDCDDLDSDYPAADYRGEWLHVNDHGNATLYVRGEDGTDKEIWAVV